MSQPQENNVPVQRAIQETAYYCGAASTVMVLTAFNGTLKQADAYNAIRAADVEPDAFYSDPSGISSCLDDPHVPDTLNLMVRDFSAIEGDKLLAQLYHNLAALHFPCPALVNAGAHWVVIDGIRVSSANGGVQVMGVYVVDPWPGEPDRKYVPVDALLSAPYILENNYGTRWKGKLVTISDASGPPTTLRVTRFTPAAVRSHLLAAAPVTDAIQALTSQGFSNTKPPMAGGGPNAVVAVTGLFGAAAYKLVLIDAIANTSFHNLVYVAVDAVSGALLEVATNSSSVSILSDVDTLAKAQVKYVGSNVIVEPGVFWAPNSILRSRFSTVRKVKIDGRDMFLLPNGDVRSSLRRPRRGGG